MFQKYFVACRVIVLAGLMLVSLTGCRQTPEPSTSYATSVMYAT